MDEAIVELGAGLADKVGGNETRGPKLRYGTCWYLRRGSDTPRIQEEAMMRKVGDPVSVARRSR